MNEALEKLKVANGNGKTSNSMLSSILAGIIVAKLKEYFNIELSAEDAIYLCGGIGIAFGLIAKIVRIKFGKKGGGTALAGDTRRGFIRLPILALLFAMSALLLTLPGCAMLGAPEGVSVTACDKAESGLRVIHEEVFKCAIQGKEICQYVLDHMNPSPDERAVFEGFLKRFSEIDEADLESVRTLLDEFRAAIEAAQKKE